jgi:hypothetical protein
MSLSLVTLFAMATVVHGADTVVVTLGTSRPSARPIPSDLASFSYEVDCVPGMTTYNGGVRTSFVNLLSALQAPSGGRGPNIRIGGNSADKSAYVSGTLPAGDTYRITTADFHAYKAAVPLWNGTITVGLNFRAGTDSTLELAHIAGLATVIPLDSDLIDGFEIGNECDLYFENGIRKPAYSAADYQKEWTVIATALQKALPTPTRLQGAVFGTGPPAHDKFSDIIDSIITRGSKARLLSSMSQHNYPLNVCHGAPTPSLYSLLANAKGSDDNAAAMAPFVAAARASGLPYYMGEANSVACGGAVGVSDVFGAALWAVDSVLAHVAVGIERYNFHGCTGGAYTAIGYDTSAGAPDTPKVNALFYGMWVLATATRKGATMLSATVTSSNPLVRVWAMMDSDGKTRVVIIHKDGNATAPATVTVTPASGPASGSAILARLAPSSGGLFTKSGISFGGLTFDGSPDGKPQGTPVSEKVPAAGGAFVFTVQPASLAVLDM